jgi:hypothetical protein
MLPLCPNTIAWGLAAVHLLGIGSAWLARVSEGTNRQLTLQLLFLLLLILVALGTWPALMIGRGQCLASGTTLAIMVLMVVWDFSSGRQQMTV